MEVSFFQHLVVPVLIFIAKVSDVSLGTVRIILVSKSYKLYAALVGFFEVLIWIIAIGFIFQDLNNWVTYSSYALGFSVGTYVGIMLEEKIAIGTLLLQVISKSSTKELQKVFQEKHIRFYKVVGDGKEGIVDILYVIVTRKNYKHVSTLIKEHNPDAFFAVEDINIVKQELGQVLESGSHYSLSQLMSRFKRRR